MPIWFFCFLFLFACLLFDSFLFAFLFAWLFGSAFPVFFELPSLLLATNSPVLLSVFSLFASFRYSFISFVILLGLFSAFFLRASTSSTFLFLSFLLASLPRFFLPFLLIFLIYLLVFLLLVGFLASSLPLSLLSCLPLYLPPPSRLSHSLLLLPLPPTLPSCPPLCTFFASCRSHTHVLKECEIQSFLD